MVPLFKASTIVTIRFLKPPLERERKSVFGYCFLSLFHNKIDASFNELCPYFTEFYSDTYVS